METDTLYIKTYRYKFTDELSHKMHEFSKIHAEDDRETFKEAFDEWKKDNTDIISKENKRLESDGYTGDIYKKIYSSVRYYYRKKSNKKTDAKQRRKYITINREFLDSMDGHIMTSYRNYDRKPADAYEDFMARYSDEVSNETESIMSNHTITKEDTYAKIKKTYKNRYFLFKKSNE